MIYDTYSEFQKAVFERDKNTCVMCGRNKEHDLHLHIINGNYSMRVIENGITLCGDCLSNSNHYNKNNKMKTYTKEELYDEIRSSEKKAREAFFK